MWSFFARDPVKDFAYEILPDAQEQSGIWSLHRGKRKVKKATRQRVTVGGSLFMEACHLAG